MDCSLPASSAHGIFQARVLEWVAIAFSDSCLENPMDGGVWQTAIHRVTQSWTGLKRLSSSMLVWLRLSPKLCTFCERSTFWFTGLWMYQTHYVIRLKIWALLKVTEKEPRVLSWAELLGISCLSLYPQAIKTLRPSQNLSLAQLEIWEEGVSSKMPEGMKGAHGLKKMFIQVFWPFLNWDVCFYWCWAVWAVYIFWILTLIQFSSVAQSCPTLRDPMNRSMPGHPVHHQLPEFTQTHVRRVGDAI